MKRETYLRKPWKLENESVKLRDVLRYYAVLWIRTRSDPKIFFGHVGSTPGTSIPDLNRTFLTKIANISSQWPNSVLITYKMLTML
jgi:hypothetical protein